MLCFPPTKWVFVGCFFPSIFECIGVISLLRIHFYVTKFMGEERKLCMGFWMSILGVFPCYFSLMVSKCTPSCVFYSKIVFRDTLEVKNNPSKSILCSSYACLMGIDFGMLSHHMTVQKNRVGILVVCVRV